MKTAPPESTTTPVVTYSIDDDGLGWITFDDPVRRANLFATDVRATLQDVIARVETEPPKALILCSAKERIFVAGADLHELAALPDAPSASEFARTGQLLFDRLARLNLPVVAAIHGACAGGGFEMALACHWRIASDAPVTRIGLPETSIGTIPGWGGCVRLPRLIGAEPALHHILAGRLLPAAEAAETGLIDEVVPAAQLQERTRAAAKRLTGGTPPARPTPDSPRSGLFEELRQRTFARTGGHQPAPLAAIEVVERTFSLAVPTALAVEAEAFGSVTADPVGKAMLHGYFLRESAKKRTLEGWFPAVPAPVAPIRRVGVVGAGVMGSGIAHWLAWHGFEVALRDVRPEFVERGMGVVRRLFADGVRRSRLSRDEADTALQRIQATIDWEAITSCDLVVEAIVEDVAAKRALFTELAARVPPNTLLASNSSALPIEDIAGHVPHPERTLGIHFFNPVSRMPLVELILGPETSAETASSALHWVQGLGKQPIICRSAPGFLVTRVLFFYLNAAVRCREAGLPSETIDGAMREFGWPMGPLRLIDEVGLDVTAAIFAELARYYPDRFTPTHLCRQLLESGLAGRKNGSGSGFYTYADGGEVPNPAVERCLEEAPRAAGTDSAPSPGDLTERLMRVMITEAERCLAEGVVHSADEIDFALLVGAGYPAFRGGLLYDARTSRDRH
jgi:3-hydroxyacyl-CoA dehydrogenase / enoyl-CoA hydratase / 3-hydroxybutyryl-CoA epimerase